MRTQIKLFFSGFHSCQHQQIFCKASHALGVASNDLQKFASAVIEQTVRFEQRFSVAADRGQGRAQFVGDIGDKIAPRFFHALNFRDVMQHADHAAIG